MDDSRISLLPWCEIALKAFMFENVKDRKSFANYYSYIIIN